MIKNSSKSNISKELSKYCIQSARSQIQEGTLSTSLGSICVATVLFCVYAIYGLHHISTYIGFTFVLFANLIRLYLQADRKSQDLVWLTRLSFLNATIALSYCWIMATQFTKDFHFLAVIINYIVINALVAASVFWQFMRRLDVYFAIGSYLTTAAAGVYFWSDHVGYTFLVVTVIFIYMAFLLKQVSLKRRAWFTQKSDEFELRQMMSQLPKNLFGQEAIKEFASEGTSVHDLHEIIISQLQSQFQASQEAEREIAKVDKMASIGEMVSGIMHEINNPIAIIASRVQLLERLVNQKYSADGNLLKHLEVISRNAFRASKIISGTKALVRETNEQNFQWSTLGDIKLIFEDLMKEKCEQNQIEVRFVFSNCDETTKIFCFPLQIGQVLINLASNSIDAIKNLPENSRWVRIVFEKDQQRILVRAQDSGRGLNQEIANKIEKPFFTSKKPGEGSGLGLHISRRIVESHKGKLYYNPTSQNTEFIIELPVEKMAS